MAIFNQWGWVSFGTPLLLKSGATDIHSRILKNHRCLRSRMVCTATTTLVVVSTRAKETPLVLNCSAVKQLSQRSTHRHVRGDQEDHEAFQHACA